MADDLDDHLLRPVRLSWQSWLKYGSIDAFLGVGLLTSPLSSAAPWRMAISSPSENVSLLLQPRGLSLSKLRASVVSRMIVPSEFAYLCSTVG